jgi:murein DD-endopeptidase MepM/ murein hydrolase activator NlpD
MRLWTLSLAGLLLATSVFLSAPARADITHVVASGHTIQTIANRYRVRARAIVAANKNKDPRHLKPGDTLIIPGVNAGESKKKATPKKPSRTDSAKPAAHRTTPRRSSRHPSPAGA